MVPNVISGSSIMTEAAPEGRMCPVYAIPLPITSGPRSADFTSLHGKPKEERADRALWAVECVDKFCLVFRLVLTQMVSH
jgi:hypothetical protein